jgi:hypothetical protein
MTQDSQLKTARNIEGEALGELPHFAISPIGNVTFNGTSRRRVNFTPDQHAYNSLNA